MRSYGSHPLYDGSFSAPLYRAERLPSSLAPSLPYPSDGNYDIKRPKISNCFLAALETVIVTVCIFDSFEVYNSTAAG